jgi:hypothetical protein
MMINCCEAPIVLSYFLLHSESICELQASPKVVQTISGILSHMRGNVCGDLPVPPVADAADMPLEPPASDSIVASTEVAETALALVAVPRRAKQEGACVVARNASLNELLAAAMLTTTPRKETRHIENGSNCKLLIDKLLYCVLRLHENLVVWSNYVVT